jgi:hypothetical protein
MTMLTTNKTVSKSPTYTNIRNMLKNALVESSNSFLSRLYLQGFTVEQKSDIELVITNSRTGTSYTAYMIDGNLIIKNGKKAHSSCKYTLNRNFALNDFLHNEKAVVVSEDYTVKTAFVSSGCVLELEAADNVGLNGALALNSLVTISTVASYGPVNHFFIDNETAYKAKGATAVRNTLINLILNNGGSYQHQKVSNNRKKVKKETLVESIIRKAMIKGYKNICKK